MKTKNTFFRLLILLGCVFTLFIGCKEEEEDDVNYGVGSPKDITISVAASAGVKYYSLSSGTMTEVTEATAIASKNWDIAFQRSRLIYTNSGVTATTADSGGLGGVWYTDKTDFSKVSDADRVTTIPADYAGLNVDTTKYTAGQTGATSSQMNVMTYLGYASGSGNSSEDCYQMNPTPTGSDYSTYKAYNYDKKSAITASAGMPPVYGVSEQVYIIRHGTGDKYSKIQIADYTSTTGSSASDTYDITYQNF
jgi:hypothetical protein